MKTLNAFFLFCITLSAITLTAEDKKITCHFQHIPLSEALNELIREHHIPILYSSAQTDSVKLSASCINCTADQVLQRVLKNTSFQYHKHQNQYVVIPQKTIPRRLKKIHGLIFNRETSEPLPNANIQIVNTYRGTISNAQGQFQLNLPQLPAKVRFRYIGFETAAFEITPASPETLTVAMKPAVIPMQSITVTDEDPAMGIMREVIKRKQKWMPKLKNLHAECYGRMILSNDTSIACIAESQSDIYWHHEKGYREIIRSGRMTNNISSMPYLPSTPFVINFYDDNIHLSGFDFIGPTHPDALNAYRFKYAGERVLDGKAVFDIDVFPRSRVNACFEGRISVLDELYGMVEVALRPGNAFQFPMPIQRFDVLCKQQYNHYDDAFWLPADLHFDGQIQIAMTGFQMPVLHIHQNMRIANFELNILLPDTLFTNHATVDVDSSSILKDQAQSDTSLFIPMTRREILAYTTLDSSHTLEKAFQPRGFLGRMSGLSLNVGNNSMSISAGAGNQASDTSRTDRPAFLSGIQPVLGFNRVDGFHIGAVRRFSLQNNVTLHLKGGYNTASKKGFYNSGIQWHHPLIRLSLTRKRGTQTFYQTSFYPAFLTDMTALFGCEAVNDYYWEDGWTVNIGKDWIGRRIQSNFQYQRLRMQSLEKQTNYNLLNRNVAARPNPALDCTRLNLLRLSLHLGDGPTSFAVVGRKGLSMTFESSAPHFLGNKFDYTQFFISGQYQFPTFFRRRLMPNVLDIQLTASYSTGELPVHRMASLPSGLNYYTPFGAFRTLKYKQFAGEKTVGLFYEHNFRTVPFEWLHIDFLVDHKISLILHGASGKTWMGQRAQIPSFFTNKWHHEWGLSLNGLFGLLRIDCTQDLETRVWHYGISAGRLF